MIHLDFETRSKVDIYDVGAWAYSTHPSTEILCMAYAIDDEEVQLFSHDRFRLNVFNNVLQTEAKKETLFSAYNAFFEQCIWQNILVKKYGWPRIPIKQWRCTMAKARARALPAGLANCGEALNASIKKSDEGHRVMMKMSKPASKGGWHESPEDFQKLYAYCVQDVEAERAIDQMLPDLIPEEQTIWFLDQLINQRGIYVDSEVIRKALEFIETYTKILNNNVEIISDGHLDGVSRRTAVLQWCHNQGVPISGYTKLDVQRTLKLPNLPDSVKQILETKLQLGKTSVKKYKSMSASQSDDGRIRDTLIYHGASTGRWAGKLIQLQNLPKGNISDTNQAIRLLEKESLEDFQIFYPDVMGTLSSCIRGMIVAAPGNDLIVADYNAIEARVLMWLAGEELGLIQFKNGVDLYVQMAQKIYGKKEISKTERNLGKAAVLGCGYGMGREKFFQTCCNWGIEISQEIADVAVRTYRETYKRVTLFWYQMELSALNAVKTKDKIPGIVTWFLDNTSLQCRLPSGRSLTYNQPSVKKIKTLWGEEKDALHYYGLTKVEGKTTTKWDQQHTYGGKLVENITQAVARDILAAAMLRCEQKGYPVIFSVHDEIVSEIKETFGSVKEYERILCDNPAWANGCPITAEGWRGKRYKK
jgi:DNA polymerase